MEKRIIDTSAGTEALGGARLFQGLDERGLKESASLALSVERKPEEVFFRQGETAARFFLLCRGQVKLIQTTPEGHQIVVRYAGRGEMFGCVPVYGGKEYPATATALVRCAALGWDRPATDHLMEQHPRIAVNALQLLGEELAEVRLRYQELATERVEQRVARALLRFVRHAGRKVETGVLVEFPLSRQDLAEFTGTTMHTVSRILSAWQDQGLIQSGRKRVIVRKPHELVALAEDLFPKL